jgi:uncharacterized protein
MQDDVFEFLSSPSLHGGAEVRRCDTHAAAVFLAGDRALKVKKAVRFPFLDYSSLDKRKAACRAELEVNRRFSPELYRRIVAVTRESDGRLALDGKGEPIEWAVEMMRFDESRTLDHMADRGKFDDAMPKKLAAMVASMHRRAEPVDAAPWLDALPKYVGRNTAAFQEQRVFSPNTVTELDEEARKALERLRPLLTKRGQQGLVRRGHGDLHLGNIAVLGDKPIPFDAIEFDPVIAAGDVLYDLAFLLMDLVERDLVGAANRVLNGYFAETRRGEDDEGLEALPFFMSLRAAIRANVTAARLKQTQPHEHEELVASAKRYFQLALDLLAPATPMVICTAGLSGTGKSVLAQSLATALKPIPGALVLRSDVERKAAFGVGETEKLPPEAYRPGASERIYGLLTERTRRIAQAGYSVIVDAVFAKEFERAAIEAAARDAGASFHGLFLTADLQTRLKRIGGRGPDASDADAKVALQQEEFNLGPMNWSKVDASGTPAETLASAQALLGR